MSQHDLDVANATGATVRSDLNNALKALGSTSKGATAPASPQTGQLWLEDDNPSSTIWTLRIYDGADWVAFALYDTTNNVITMAEQPYQNVTVSTGVMDIGAKATAVVQSATTTTVTGLGTAAVGVTRDVWHTAAQQYTYNVTSLICPGAANFTTVSGDVLRWYSLGSGNWRCIGIYRLALPITTAVTSLTGSGGITASASTGAVTLTLNTNNAVAVGASALLQNLTGASVSAGATLTTNGTNAQYGRFNSSSQFAGGSNVPTGQVWRNIGGTAVANNEGGLFQRVS